MNSNNNIKFIEYLDNPSIFPDFLFNDKIDEILYSTQKCPNCDNNFIESQGCNNCGYLVFENSQEIPYKQKINKTETKSNSKNIKFSNGFFSVYKVDLDEKGQIKYVYFKNNNNQKFRLIIDYLLNNQEVETINFSEQEEYYRYITGNINKINNLKLLKIQSKVKVGYSEFRNIGYYRINYNMLNELIYNLLNKYHFNK